MFVAHALSVQCNIILYKSVGTIAFFKNIDFDLLCANGASGG
jgi:hypothetical protein